MRRLELHVRDGDGFENALKAIRNADPVDHYVHALEQQDRKLVSVFMRNENSQNLVDALQQCLEEETGWRLTVSSLEATVPEIEESRRIKRQSNQKALREELLTDVEAGAKLDRDFLIMVVFSTIVAAVGLNSDGVAAVIGAMVIAPLLGPILGFSMGAALGKFDLLRQSSWTLLAGIGVALLCAILLSAVMPLNMQSRELLSRAEVRLDGLALALAAGGAAALSLSRGQGTTLVGVMVAAALLPPGAAVGLFIGSGEWTLALRAGLLLLLNVAALVVAALGVFRYKQIKPRTWIEQKHATRAIRINAIAWAFFLALAVILIVYLDLGAAVQGG